MRSRTAHVSRRSEAEAPIVATTRSLDSSPPKAALGSGHDFRTIPIYPSARRDNPLEAAVQREALASRQDAVAVRQHGTPGSLQRYFVLNQDEMNRVITTQAAFPGQETGGDADHPRSFLKDTGQPNVVIKNIPPPLRVSDNGNLAIEDADLTSRQPKAFFLDAGMIDPANAQMESAGSAYRIVQDSGTIQVPDHGGTMHTLVSAVGQKAVNPAERGSALTGPEFCNEMGESVMGASGEARKLQFKAGAERPDFDLAVQYRDAMPKYLAAVAEGKPPAEAEASAKALPALTMTKKVMRPTALVKVAKKKKDDFEAALPRMSPLWQLSGARTSSFLKGTYTYPYDFASAEARAAFEREPAYQYVKSITDTGTVEKEMMTTGKEQADEMDRKNAEQLASYGNMDAATRDKMSSDLGINEYASPKVGQAYMIGHTGPVTAVPDVNGVRQPGTIKDLRKDQDMSTGFPYHWAGVVAVDGADNVTLENYARNDEDQVRGGGTDLRSYFQMYGSKAGLNLASVSFHEYWSQYFANPITAVFGKDKTD